MLAPTVIDAVPNWNRNQVDFVASIDRDNVKLVIPKFRGFVVVTVTVVSG